MQKIHGKVKTNGRVRAKASKLHTCIPSIFPWTKSATPRNPPDRGKTSTASLAPVKSQEQDLDRHASLPSRLSVDRQDGADGCAVSDTGPAVKTAADQVETDPGVESQGRSQAQLALQRSADFPWLGNETNRKRTGEWNGKDLPTMCDKNVPAKTLPPSAFRFGCARWRVERSHDVLTKAPSRCSSTLYHDVCVQKRSYFLWTRTPLDPRTIDRRPSELFNRVQGDVRGLNFVVSVAHMAGYRTSLM